MPYNTFFWLGLTFILMHEMDAVRCREWRIFPGLSQLNDKWGFIVFMFAHIPLFFLLFYGLNQADNNGLKLGLNIFFIIHMVVHLLFLKNKRNEFKDLISWALIAGAAVCGAIALTQLV